MNHVNAGVGKDGQVRSFVENVGVALQMDKLRGKELVHNGFNLTFPEAPIILRRSTATDNRAYRVYVNTSSSFTVSDS